MLAVAVGGELMDHFDAEVLIVVIDGPILTNSEYYHLIRSVMCCLRFPPKSHLTNSNILINVQFVDNCIHSVTARVTGFDQRQCPRKCLNFRVNQRNIVVGDAIAAAVVVAAGDDDDGDDDVVADANAAAVVVMMTKGQMKKLN